MANGSLPLTSNRLDIGNPNRLYGLVRFVTGCALGLLLFIRLPFFLKALNMRIPFILRSPEHYLDQAGAYEILLGLALVFAVIAVFMAISDTIGGLKSLMTFFVPVDVPKGILPPDQIKDYGTTRGAPREGSVEALKNFFVKRLIAYEQPSGPLQTAMAFFSQRLRYLTKNQRVLAEKLIRSVPFWAIALLVLSIPLFLPSDLTFQLESEIGPWPFPSYPAMVAAFAVMIRALALLASIPGAPGIQVQEKREQSDAGGNPINFFHHINQAFETIRRGNFANRKLLEAEPVLGRTTKGETDKFTGETLVETQPLPLERGFPVNALILDVGGGMLRFAGYATLLFITSVSLTGPINVVFLILAGLAAMRIGSDFIRLGFSLHQTFRFHSDAFWVILKGTFTSSRIGLGDGRGGQLYTERSTMQSEMYVHIYAGRVITECSPLEAPRVIVDSLHSEEFEQRLEYFLQEVRNYEDNGKKLAGIDMTEQSVKDIVGANVQIEQLTRVAKQGMPVGEGEVNSSLEAPAAPGQIAQDAEQKLCPDCAEYVKQAARKCRFCGYLFDGEEDRQINDPDAS